MINYYLGLFTGLICGFLWGYVLFHKKKTKDKSINIYGDKK